MDFARKQLEKYGWTDGKGLGKNGNGISEALKPKLKRSVTGVGYDPAKDFTEHWWSQLYNKAASNVQVEEKNGKTKKITPKDKDFEITNSTLKLKKSKKSHSDGEYSDFFVKTEVMDNDRSKSVKIESQSEEDEDEKPVKMSDEELFRACGGRTAHKGARHGLRALGKLARIEQQEQILLHESRFQGYSHAKKIKSETVDSPIVEDTLLSNDEEVNNSKKKKKKKKRCKDYNDVIVAPITEVLEGVAIKENKTPEKLSKITIQLQIDNNSINNKEIDCSKKKIKRNVENIAESVATEESKSAKKSKKKRKDKTDFDNANEEFNNEVIVKQKKRKHRPFELKVTLQIDEALTNKICKRKKKESVELL